MQAPYSQYIPVFLTDLTPQVFPLEQMMSVGSLTNPRLRLVNCSTTESVHVLLEESEDLGATFNPLKTGKHTVTILDHVFAPMEYMWAPFASPFLSAKTPTSGPPPSLSHTLTVTSQAGLDQSNNTIQVIFRVSLYGTFDQVLSVTPPATF